MVPENRWDTDQSERTEIKLAMVKPEHYTVQFFNQNTVNLYWPHIVAYAQSGCALYQNTAKPLILELKSGQQPHRTSI